MQYIVNTGFCLGKGIDAAPGDIVELPVYEAADKLMVGQISVYQETEKPKRKGAKDA